MKSLSNPTGLYVIFKEHPLPSTTLWALYDAVHFLILIIGASLLFFLLSKHFTSQSLCTCCLFCLENSDPGSYVHASLLTTCQSLGHSLHVTLSERFSLINLYKINLVVCIILLTHWVYVCVYIYIYIYIYIYYIKYYIYGIFIL